jgi:hypothetical protein
LKGEVLGQEVLDISRTLSGFSALILTVCMVRLLLEGWIPAAMQLTGYSSKLYLLALLAAVSAYFVPGLMYWCMREFGDVSIVVNGTAAMMVALAGLACHFLPTIVARIEKRSYWGWVLFINCLFLLPFGWECCFVWACGRGKNVEVVAAVGEVAEVQAPSVSDNEGVAETAALAEAPPPVETTEAVETAPPPGASVDEPVQD